MPGSSGSAVFGGDAPGGVLQTEGAHLGGGGSQENDARRIAGFGEVRILAEESVARMDRFRTGTASGIEQRGDGEIAFHAHRLIGLAHVQRVPVGVGINGHGAYTHFS